MKKLIILALISLTLVACGDTTQTVTASGGGGTATNNQPSNNGNTSEPAK